MPIDPTPVQRQLATSAHIPGHAQDAGPPHSEALTARETAVMDLIIEGLSTRLVARRLEVRPRTVDKHVERVLRKLGARSRIEAAAILRCRAVVVDSDTDASRSAQTKRPQ